MPQRQQTWPLKQEKAVQVHLAHLRLPARGGGWTNSAVFDARSASGSAADNSRLLARLTVRARASSLRVDRAALAYVSGGGVQFFGNPSLVDYLSKVGVPRWTHSLSV